jgi:hypothetical protein
MRFPLPLKVAIFFNVMHHILVDWHNICQEDAAFLCGFEDGPAKWFNPSSEEQSS